MRAMRDISDIREQSMQGDEKPLRSAKYLLRFTPEEKAELEQKVRQAAADGQRSLSLAEALRIGARIYLDNLLEPDEDSADLDQDQRAA